MFTDLTLWCFETWAIRWSRSGDCTFRQRKGQGWDGGGGGCRGGKGARGKGARAERAGGREEERGWKNPPPPHGGEGGVGWKQTPSTG